MEMPPMITEQRKRALNWFNDHSQDVNAVLGRKRPTTRMRNLMVKEGQLDAERIAFSQHKFQLTEHGKTLLANLKASQKKRKAPP
jgi:hypothetical protein